MSKSKPKPSVILSVGYTQIECTEAEAFAVLKALRGKTVLEYRRKGEMVDGASLVRTDRTVEVEISTGLVADPPKKKPLQLEAKSLTLSPSGK